MRLASRITSVGASATIAITAKARRMQADGIDVVSFGAGEPDFPTPECIRTAAKAALDAGDTKYTPQRGAELVRAIVDKLARENHMDVTPEQVVVTFGGKHALYDLFQVLVEPGRKVLIPAPYWVSYPEMVRLAGGEPVILPTRRADGFKITPRQVLDAAGDAGVLVLNSPCNPTGVTYRPEEIRAIGRAVLQTDLIVLSDEIYEKLIYGDAEFVSFATLGDGLAERTVTVNGLAKTFAMTGWRLGWAAGPAEIIGAVRRLMSHETTHPVSFAQAGALAAYTDPAAGEAAEAMRAEFARRGTYMAGRLNAIDRVECIEPTGAFYCFPDVSAYYGRRFGDVDVRDSMTFARAALDDAKVALVPGAAFGEDRCVRLSFATGMEQIEKGLDRLEKLLK